MKRFLLGCAVLCAVGCVYGADVPAPGPQGQVTPDGPGYVEWLEGQGPITERFGESLLRLKQQRVVHEVAS